MSINMEDSGQTMSSPVNNVSMHGAESQFPVMNEELLLRFYSSWFGELDEGHVEIRPIPHDRGDRETYFACLDARKSFPENVKPELIATYINSQRRKIDVNQISRNWSIAPRAVALEKVPKEDGKGYRWIGGEKEDVACMTGIWADVDAHGNVDDEANLAHADAALELLIARLGIAPAFIIKSGGKGGKHIYFRFSEPVSKTDGERLGRKLSVALKSDSSVAEAARIMRIPGSWHTKTGTAILVDIVHQSDDTVELSDMEEALDDLIARYNFVVPTPIAVTARDGGKLAWADVDIEAAQGIKDICARMNYYLSDSGTREIKYPSWLHMASWAHALSSDPELFERWGTAYSRLHKNGTPLEKWNDTADMHPVSCHRARQDVPLESCKTCPLFEAGKNPTLHLRRVLGGGKIWGAPSVMDKLRHDVTNVTDVKEWLENNQEDLARAMKFHRAELTEWLGELATMGVALSDIVSTNVAPSNDDDGITPPSDDTPLSSGPARPVLELAVDNSTIIKTSYDSVGKIAEEIKGGADIFASRDNAIPFLKQL